MKRFIFISILFSAIAVNLFSASFSPQKGGNCYTLDIPDYMTRTFQLNDAASLQYQNINKEAYCIVIEDSKEHLSALGIKFVDAKDFLDNFLSSYMVDVADRNVSKNVNFNSNGNSHSQAELTWSNDDGSYYMLITSVETKYYFYKILCWIIAENKKLLKDDFIKISKSLKD